MEIFFQRKLKIDRKLLAHAFFGLLLFEQSRTIVIAICKKKGQWRIMLFSCIGRKINERETFEVNKMLFLVRSKKASR